MAELTIKLEIVTPERVVLKTDVLQATVPTQSGEITILPHHVPLVSILKPGVIEVKKQENKEIEIMSVSGGFVEVFANKIVILADTAERAEELDENRISEAMETARKLKQEHKNKKDISKINIKDIDTMTEKGLARSKAIKRWKKIKNINKK